MYGKHFQSMYTGSMVGSGPVTFAVWGYVISHVRDSYVELNPVILAAIIGCTPDDIDQAISALCQPDPRSRSKDYEGRRLIQSAEFLFFVPTYEKYHNIRNDEGRREYMRNYMRDYRDKQKGKEPDQGEAVNNDVNEMFTVNESKQELAHISESVSVYESDLKNNSPIPFTGNPRSTAGRYRFKIPALEIIDFVNHKTGGQFLAMTPSGDFTEDAEVIIDRLLEGFSVQQMKSTFMKKCRHWRDDEKMCQHLNPQTVFSKKKFASYLGEKANKQEAAHG